jgi:hypothetical protein
MNGQIYINGNQRTRVWHLTPRLTLATGRSPFMRWHGAQLGRVALRIGWQRLASKVLIRITRSDHTQGSGRSLWIGHCGLSLFISHPAGNWQA